VVVNFAIKDNGQAVIRISHRLLAGGGIKDDEPAKAKEDRIVGIQIKSFVVGTPVDQASGHCPKISFVTSAQKPSQTAHQE